MIYGEIHTLWKIYFADYEKVCIFALLLRRKADLQPRLNTNLKSFIAEWRRKLSRLTHNQENAGAEPASATKPIERATTKGKRKTRSRKVCWNNKMACPPYKKRTKATPAILVKRGLLFFIGFHCGKVNRVDNLPTRHTPARNKGEKGSKKIVHQALPERGSNVPPLTTADLQDTTQKGYRDKKAYGEETSWFRATAVRVQRQCSPFNGTAYVSCKEIKWGLYSKPKKK